MQIWPLLKKHVNITRMTWACSKSSEVLNLISSSCMLGSSIKHDLFLDVHFRSQTILIFVWNYFTRNSKQGNWHEPRARGTPHGSRLVPFRDTRSFSVSIRLLLVARGEHIDGSSMVYHNQVTQKELLESMMQIWEAFFWLRDSINFQDIIKKKVSEFLIDSHWRLVLKMLKLL